MQSLPGIYFAIKRSQKEQYVFSNKMSGLLGVYNFSIFIYFQGMHHLWTAAK